MSELDVVKLQTGLERAHGLDAVYLGNRSRTSFVYLVTARGLPLHVGWFDNSQKNGGGPSHYAVTSHPEQPRSIHHRFILTQQPGNDFAELTEESDADFLEGYDDAPTVFSRERLDQPTLGRTIRAQVLGACVLTSATGHAFDSFAWVNDYDVPAVTAYGLELITAGNYLAQIDHPALNGFAAAGQQIPLLRKPL